MKRFILFAPNVGSGGGLVLLRALVNAWPADRPVMAIFDERSQLTIESDGPTFPIRWFQSSISGRLRAELLLTRISTKHDVVLCFHSLPPILPNAASVICYVHNSNLVGLVPSSNSLSWVSFRCSIERIILRLFGKRISNYVVQTPTMAEALKDALGRNARPIEVIPFIDPLTLTDRTSTTMHRGPRSAATATDRTFDFIYVSDGAVHKNHATLFQAWELLARDGIFPSLALTLHPVRDATLRAELERIRSRTGIDIVDLGQMPHQRLLEMYRKCRALLFASHSESFGIPLLEASAVELPILAAERDFVRDICQPAETFDPLSPRSIARAVLRFLGHPPDCITPLAPHEFVAAVWGMGSPENE